MNMKHELPSWDMPANGDKEVKSNRPDIIVMPLIKDEVLKKCLLIDMAIPAELNIPGFLKTG